MRISEYFELSEEQPSLDFVDVKLETDVALFIDPTALSLLDTVWGAKCRSLIQDYFSLVLRKIKDSEDDNAKLLLSVLNEPNETRLGYSSDKPRGHGMGKKLAESMWEALKESTAVRTGIIRDLEDTALMIDGIASDVISDISTNIIREPLLEYTEAMCKEYDIPTEQVASGSIWNPAEQKWQTQFVNQPVVDDKRLLLVPKALVRKTITFQADNYYNLYLLERLQQEEASRGFVRLLKNNEARPLTKKTLKQKYGEAGKEQNRRLTPGREDVLDRYRRDKREKPRKPLSHEKIADSTSTEEPDWEGLLNAVKAIRPGRDGSNDYEHAIKQLFDALFYPWLMYPETQENLHGGRKIVDITYMNMAEDDFFFWLRSHYRAPYVIAECKNYNGDPENPELDQLSGRFSTRRGQFGILVCRKIENKELFSQRCKDTADDGRGYIIALDDDDLEQLVRTVANIEKGDRLNLLRDRFRKLAM